MNSYLLIVGSPFVLQPWKTEYVWHGAPTCFVGEEMFWGNDRLDDALAYAAAR